MRPFAAQEIRGNWATPLLPVNSDESLDLHKLRDDVDFLVEAKLSGIYTNGTAGEFLTQSEDEFNKISEIVAEKCESHKVPFQIGASHTSPQISLDRIRFAKEFSPCAIQVVLPDWFPLTNDEAIVFLRRAAEIADPIGLILYNPPHAKRVLGPANLGILKQAVPGFVGLKVMNGDSDWYMQMQEHVSGLSVFVPGHHLATGITKGAAGSYSNIACLHPRGAQDWYESMQTDIEAALELEGRINKFFVAYIRPLMTEQKYSNAAIDKLLAAIGGWGSAGTRLRFPYRWIPVEMVSPLRAAAERLIPELL